MFDVIKSFVYNHAVRRILPILGLGLGFVLFFYGDSIFDEGMIDATQIDWSSCSSQTRSHHHNQVRYVSCEAPASAWLAIMESPVTTGRRIDPGRAKQAEGLALTTIYNSFVVAARTDLDAMTSAQSLVQGEIYTPLQTGEAQKLIVKHEATRETRAHGLMQSQFLETVHVTTLCISKTTSHEMCEDMTRVAVYDGVDAVLTP